MSHSSSSSSPPQWAEPSRRRATQNTPPPAHLEDEIISARRGITPTSTMRLRRTNPNVGGEAGPSPRRRLMSKELEYFRSCDMQHLWTLQTALLTRCVVVGQLAERFSGLTWIF